MLWSRAMWPTTSASSSAVSSAAWCQQDTWQGTISGTVMPARSLGEMALIEVLLHGWDVARATDQQVDVSDALGAELLRCVAETADLGRQVGAYGTKVPVADNASDFAKALGLAGRSPN